MKFILLALFLFAAPASASVDSVLDDFHDAASKADAERYFGHFTKTGYFIGTDASERWPVDDFRRYAEPFFMVGKGWTYVPTIRHVSYSKDGGVAWFDEMLMNQSYGETRGSGVLVRDGETWKIAQYHLTVPIPNSLMNKVVGLIRASQKKKN